MTTTVRERAYAIPQTHARLRFMTIISRQLGQTHNENMADRLTQLQDAVNSVRAK